MKKRTDLLIEKLNNVGIECAIINDLENRIYFSGFTGRSGYLIISKDINILITDFRFVEQAKQQTAYEVIEYKQNVFETIKEVVQQNNIKIVGIEEEHTTYSQYKNLTQKVDCKFENIENIIQEIRAVKDENEILNIKAAVKLGEAAFEHMLDFVKPGLTEKEVAFELEYYLRKNGAEGLSFDSIVASGQNSALPHAEPGDKKIQYGDFITFDYGCKVNGYCSDMTRTVVVGNASEEQKKIYNIVLEAQLKALDFMQSNESCSEIDNSAREYISSKGYGKYFGHALGHGVGLNVHEAPILSSKSNGILKHGMVVTVEPGIYIPQFGGVRIEDMVIIKDEGTENLMKSPKELIII